MQNFYLQILLMCISSIGVLLLFGLKYLFSLVSDLKEELKILIHLDRRLTILETKQKIITKQVR